MALSQDGPVGESAEMDGVVVVRHCRAGRIGQSQSAKTGRTQDWIRASDLAVLCHSPPKKVGGDM